MSLLGLGNKPKPTKTEPLNHIRVSQSVLGQVRAIIMGQRRAHMNLISYTDFKSTAVTTNNGGAGGKGLGGGKNTSTSYIYSANIIAGLCEGIAAGVVNVWDTKGQFQQISASESFTVPNGGGSYQVVNHVNFVNDIGVGVTTAYSQAVNDYGSPGPVTLSGSYLAPTTNYTLNPATGTYTFPLGMGGQQVSINYSFNLLLIRSEERASIPSSPWMLTVENSAQYRDDLGVVFYPSGVPLQRVSTITGSGQYKVAAGGTYTFFSGDQGQGILITYTINDTNNSAVGAATALNFTLFPGVLGEAPWAFMSTFHPESALGYSQLAKIASNMQLDSGAAIPNYTFELLVGPFYGGGIVDCAPDQCIRQLLTNQSFGIGAQGQSVFPVSLLGDWTQANKFWVANGFFISPQIDNQRPCNSIIKEWLEAGMTASFFSEAKLKLVPYGDSSAAGNGAIYVPQTQPVFDLTDNDFISSQAGQEPIKVSRAPLDQRFTRATVQYANRLNAYNPEPLPEQDEASINRFGARSEPPVNWDFICTQQAATFAASMRVKRFVNIPSIYQFQLGWRYTGLEPMDLVTLTKLDENGNAIPPFNKLPVRITKTEDDPIKGIAITAEDFPWGTATPALYQKQGTVPNGVQQGQADPGNTKATIIEIPDRLAKQRGNILYIFCSPDNNAAWGGCTIHVSFDSVTYVYFDRVISPARTGMLQNAIAAGAGDQNFDDVTNVPQILMNDGAAIIASASQTDFDQFISLCALFSSNAAVQVNLSSFFNINGMYADGATFSSSLGINSAGLAYSSTYLGASLTTDVLFNFGPGGAPDVVNNATITLPNAAFVAIKILAAAINTNQPSQTFTVTYQDNTTDVFTQSVSNLSTPQFYPGESQAAQINYRNVFDGSRRFEPVSMYQYTFALNPAKNVKNLILPTSASVMIFAVTLVNAHIELFSYRDSALSGIQQFNLSHLHRGVYQTINQPHNIGDKFVRLDQASSEFQYDSSLYGKRIYLKFTSFNTLGFREQDISQVPAIAVDIVGSGPGVIDLNTGIIRQGKGSVSNSWAGAVSFALTTTTCTVSWSGNVTRSSVPLPGQAPTIIQQVPYVGGQLITGLTPGTQYWLYRYLDDSQPGSPMIFASNLQIGGAVGSPAIAYVSQQAFATFFTGRNDHALLDQFPLTFTTPSSGTSTGSSGGIGGTCPRGDMVVEHRERGTIHCGDLAVGDFIWGRRHGVDDWVQVSEIVRKRRQEWIEVDLACGEAPVVTPAHEWPTESEIIKSHSLTLQSMLNHRDGGLVFISGLRVIRDDDQDCISIEVDSPDHAYYLGSKDPVILSQNNIPDIS